MDSVQFVELLCLKYCTSTNCTFLSLKCNWLLYVLNFIFTLWIFVNQINRSEIIGHTTEHRYDFCVIFAAFKIGILELLLIFWKGKSPCPNTNYVGNWSCMISKKKTSETWNESGLDYSSNDVNSKKNTTPLMNEVKL